jgi:hypothetical protein
VTADERRSAALLFGAELGARAIGFAELDRAEVAGAVRSRSVVRWPRRRWELLALQRGWRRYEQFEDDSVEVFDAARRAVLGGRAEGPPRFLIRVDEFPNYDVMERPDRHGCDAYERFHRVLAEAGVPYLVAVLPTLAADPLEPRSSGGRALDDAEVGVLGRLRDDGVGFALHGLNHRTRHAGHGRSELEGLSRSAMDDRLDRGDAVLADIGIHPRVFVAPFNTFSANQYPALAARFDVVCGGPESVVRMGLHRTPLWRGDAVYMPSYYPRYGRAAEMLPDVEAIVARQAAVWAPITLHWEWELDDDFAGLRRLARVIGGFAAPWSEFLDACAASRQVGTPQAGGAAPAP